jgi:hypothetical protein
MGVCRQVKAAVGSWRHLQNHSPGIEMCAAMPYQRYGMGHMGHDLNTAAVHAQVNTLVF